MMDEEIRQALSEVREMKQMCGNINMKLTNIVTQRGQNWKAKLEAEYQRGLNDAWEAARKIADMWETMDNEDLLETFGVTARIGESTIGAVFKKQIANEAMLELEAYEEKQKADDEIKVGDEVKHKSNSATWTAVCIQIDGDGRHMNLMGHTGAVGYYPVDDFKKTGRHFDIDKILEEMQS